MKLIRIVALAGALTCIGTLSVQAAEKNVVLKFANVTLMSSKDAGKMFKEVAERESGGSVRIDLYPDNQLGDDRVAVESAIFGDIDVAVSSTSPLATMFSDFYLFDAPFLFLNVQQAYAGLDGPVGRAILKGLEKKGLKGLAYWENGFRDVTSNKVAVRRPEDVKGMKIRTMENEIHLATWTVFGAKPMPMAFTELFTALQQGVVDGQENSLGGIDGNKFQEVQKYVSLTQHAYTPHIVVMNLARYNALSDRQRAAIDAAAVLSTEFQRRQSQKYEAEILDRLRQGRTVVTELTDEDKAVWRRRVDEGKVLERVRAKMENPQHLDRILAQ